MSIETLPMRRRPRTRLVSVPRRGLYAAILIAPFLLGGAFALGRWTAPEPDPDSSVIPGAMAMARPARPSLPEPPAPEPFGGGGPASRPSVLAEPENLAEPQDLAGDPEAPSELDEGGGLSSEVVAEPAAAVVPVGVPPYELKAPRRGFGLQVAAHDSIEGAEAFLREFGSELTGVGPIHVVTWRNAGKDWYRIRVGVFLSAQRAREARGLLPSELAGAMVVRYR